jgi:PAS domain S-box-containing protein
MEGASLRRFLLVINLLGGAVMLSALRHPSALAHAPSLIRMVAAAAAFVIGELALLHIRIGDENHSFTWSEAAMILGLVLVPSPWARIIGPASVALVHIWCRRSAVKVAFNAFSFATALYLARVVYDFVGGADPRIYQLRTWAALALASFVFFLWNGGTVAAAVAFSQGLRFRDVYRKGLALSSFVWLGNTSFGVVVVTAGAHDRRLLAVVPVFLIFLYVADRGYLRAMEERDQWRLLQEASAGLVCVDGEALLGRLIEGTRDLLRADFVELVVMEGRGEAIRYRSAERGARERVEGEIEMLIPDAAAKVTGGPAPECFARPTSTGGTGAPVGGRADRLEHLGLSTALAAPLVDGRGIVGLLTVGFERPHRVSDRHQHVLSTFASQVTIALGNARLFAAASEERAKLDQIVSNTSDGIFLVDGHGTVLSWNTAMARITGQPASSAEGRPLFEGISARTADGSEATVGWLTRMLGSTTPGSTLVSVKPAGSEIRWLNLSIAPARSGNDSGALVVVARDVTSLREADEAKQEFVATVSHELRTPLTPLKGFLLTLLRDDFNPSPEQLDEILHRMLQQSERLEVLIEDLLSMSRLERGEFRIEPTIVELEPLIDSVIAERGRTVTRTGEHHVAAMADAGRVVQVLANLLSNAEKYSPEDGDIGVSVAVLAGPDGSDGVVELRVSDQGPGIPEDQREAVFERFRRLGHHLTREQGGTGLGLYIARRLVESMGGCIWVEGDLGAGSTFVFTLPIAAEVIDGEAPLEVPTPLHPGAPADAVLHLAHVS